MEIVEGIEGDYIETKKNNLFFDIKGLLHPDDRKICFLRFYPHPKGDRIKKEIHFKKVYNIDERYSILTKLYPNYLFYSKELDLELQGVKNDEIKHLYTPRNFFKVLKEKDFLTNIEKISKDLCELFITQGNIPENSIGISGSTMIGLNKNDSDIDLIVYGTETCLKFQQKLKKILTESNNCRIYSLDEYKAHYNWRVGGSDISFKDFMRAEKRKLHQGKFRGIDFFIRYIKSPQDWIGSFYDYKYKNYGRIKIKAKIVDSKDSIFTPCSYKIKLLNILESQIIPNKINIKDINEINSFRGRFCEHAKEGEIVLVEGKLEKVNFQNKEEYFRLLLTDQIHDKMIILK
ncbi:MAG: nucleotidyltransferase domain-containing protein [Promethearchaeota archaeon]